MDERQWSKAQELADAFGDAYSESVARVLGSALMEALSELLDIPLEGGEVKSAVTLCGSTSIDGHECSRIEGHTGGHHDKNGVGWSSTLTEPEEPQGRPHPEFLEGEAAYKAAPVGTRVGADESGAHDAMRHELDGWYCGPFRVYTSAFTARRPVERWGSGV